MKAAINGINLAYGDEGSSLPVLLIHGFPLNRQMWNGQKSALSAAGYRAITPDLRGFGDSDAPGGDCSMDLFADDMVALLDHLGIKRAVVGGMSMGGYVLLNMLERYRERIAAACFIVTRSGADDEAGKARRLAMADDARCIGTGVVADIFAKVLFADGTLKDDPALVQQVGQWMAAANPDGLAGGLLAMAGRKDYTGMLPQISLPSLIIGAGEDRAMPQENFHILTDGLQNCSSCLIAGAGHMVNMEKPAEFNACLLQFLKKVSLAP